MNVENSIAFVTGANRGLGPVFVHDLIARGARKVYAAVRDIYSLQIPGVISVRLDVTREEDIRAAAERCKDVTLLINNALWRRMENYLVLRALFLRSTMSEDWREKLPFQRGRALKVNTRLYAKNAWKH